MAWHDSGGRSTVDFREFNRKLAVPAARPCWYVLLLVDTAKGGHTNIIKSTGPQAYFSPALSASAEELSSVQTALAVQPSVRRAETLMLPPKNIKKEPTASESSSMGNWRIGLAVEIGPSEQEAEQFIRLVSFDRRGKQIRGVSPRAANTDVMATKFHKLSWAEWSLIFDTTDAEQLLERQSYALEQQ